MTMSPQAVQAFQALGLGFAFAGLLATAFELFFERRASFALLQTGGIAALASIPVLIFTAPFIIVRNTVRGRRYERRHMLSVMAATVVAGLWSMMSGRIVLDLAQLLAGA